MKNTNIAFQSIALTFIFALLFSPAISIAAEKQAIKPVSTNFIAFDDAEYHTSPDKRIGAKILVDPAKVGPSIAAMTHLTYLPGANIGSHRHVYVTEILYILEGNLTLRIGEEIKILGPNSTAYIPAKAFHEYLNDSTDVVKFLQYYSPSGPEEEYRNWTKPAVEAAVVKAAAVKKEESANVVSPALPPVPGSPSSVVLGTVVDQTASEAKTEVKQGSELILKSTQTTEVNKAPVLVNDSKLILKSTQKPEAKKPAVVVTDSKKSGK